MVDLKRCSVAWKALALGWKNARENYDSWFPEQENWVDEHGGRGICEGIDELYYPGGAITRDEYRFMRSLVDEVPENEHHPYKWSRCRFGARQRQYWCEHQSRKCLRWSKVPWDKVSILLNGISKSGASISSLRSILTYARYPGVNYLAGRFRQAGEITDVREWCERELGYIHKYFSV